MRINYEISISPWKLDEIDYLVKFANNKNISDNLTDAFPHPYTVEDGIKFITTYMNDNPPRAFAIRINGKPIGSIGVFPQTDIHAKNAEMGYWLAEEYWGMGIVTKAVKLVVEYGFKTFDIDRIFARPYGTNIASQRVLEKAGMNLEARFYKTVIKNGEYKDELYYSIRNTL